MVNRATILLYLLVCGVFALSVQVRSQDINEVVSQTVVRISTFNANGERLGYGSGVVIDKSGLVVTNYHVINGAHSAKIRLPNKQEYNVIKVIASDAKIDYAVLKVDATNLQAIEISSSKLLLRGAEVYVCGYPLGISSYSLTKGNISCLGAGCFPDEYGKLPYDAIMFTASISNGNSGGALLNNKGELIGIPTLGMTANSSQPVVQNMNYAIPIDFILETIVKRASQSQYDMAEQEQKDKVRRDTEYNKLVGVYMHPEKIFSVAFIKSWVKEESDAWSSDRTARSISTMFAPENAEKAAVNGYLSEGIRITMDFPKAGNVWKAKNTEQMLERFQLGLLESNPGFSVTNIRPIKVSGREAKLVEFVGKNEKIKEPEQCWFVLFGNEKVQLRLELVCPVSKKKMYTDIFNILLDSFRFPAE